MHAAALSQSPPILPVVLHCKQIPRPLRPIVYGAWAKLYGVNTEEMGQPISAYPSLQEFFTRSLAPGARPIDDTVPLVSPVCRSRGLPGRRGGVEGWIWGEGGL